MAGKPSRVADQLRDIHKLQGQRPPGERQELLCEVLCAGSRFQLITATASRSRSTNVTTGHAPRDSPLVPERPTTGEDVGDGGALDERKVGDHVEDRLPDPVRRRSGRRRFRGRASFRPRAVPPISRASLHRNAVTGTPPRRTSVSCAAGTPLPSRRQRSAARRRGGRVPLERAGSAATTDVHRVPGGLDEVPVARQRGKLQSLRPFWRAPRRCLGQAQLEVDPGKMSQNPSFDLDEGPESPPGLGIASRATRSRHHFPTPANHTTKLVELGDGRNGRRPRRPSPSPPARRRRPRRRS